jgi:hypothetical protein
LKIHHSKNKDTNIKDSNENLSLDHGCSKNNPTCSEIASSKGNTSTIVSGDFDSRQSIYPANDLGLISSMPLPYNQAKCHSQQFDSQFILAGKSQINFINFKYLLK